MTVVSRLHSYHDEVGRMGVIIPILQMREQFLREYISCLRSHSWQAEMLRLNPELKKKPTGLRWGVCVCGEWGWTARCGSGGRLLHLGTLLPNPVPAGRRRSHIFL